MQKSNFIVEISFIIFQVNGERAPAEVYKDFRAAVLDVLSTLENQEAMLNGVTGMGRGIHDIPGSIVSVDTAPSQAANIADISNANVNTTAANTYNNMNRNHYSNHVGNPSIANAVGAHIASSVNAAALTARMTDAEVITTQPEAMITQNAATSMHLNGDAIPPVIWVIGGPGSNKATLCMKAVGLNPGWGHIRCVRVRQCVMIFVF